jgi:hypothetical protein
MAGRFRAGTEVKNDLGKTRESGFSTALKCVRSGLEKQQKNPIFSIVWRARLCPRRWPDFMSQIDNRSRIFRRRDSTTREGIP